MSEKIYAFLLRFLPGSFRKAYGGEALQLFRDRSRDERGFFPRFRLWFDLLHDLAVSIPREYGHAGPPVASSPVSQNANQILSFQILQGVPPRPEAFMIAGLISLTAVGVFAIAIGHAGNFKPFRAFVDRPHPQSYVRPNVTSPSNSQTYDDAETEAIGNGSQTANPARLKHTTTQDESQSKTTVALDSPQVLAADRQRIIEAVSTNLKLHYFDPASAQEMAEVLRAHEWTDDAAVQTGAGFAALLTSQMRSVSHDMHLEVVYSSETLPMPATTPSAGSLAQYRQAMEQSHCTFNKVEVLPRNIGYLKLNSFPDPSICQSTAASAMKSLNNADAIIFDLRDNRGGSGAMVNFLASYLFSHPAFMYDPRDTPNEQNWTHTPVAGNRLTDKPIYVLTSGLTASAAEDFTYNLKMLKRATVVGERTRGSAHAGVFYRIDDHFGMGIPRVKPTNPYSDKDWEGIGIEPDVKASAESALQVAIKLAQRKLQK